MKLSRIDLIGLNGNDGLHYEEEVVMSMTRKDFQAIASIIRTHKLAPPTGGKVVIDFLIDDLAEYFKVANGSFDKERFLRACGFYGEV